MIYLNHLIIRFKIVYLIIGISDPEEYITFYGMRNWDILMGTLVSVDMN